MDHTQQVVLQWQVHYKALLRFKESEFLIPEPPDGGCDFCEYLRAGAFIKSASLCTIWLKQISHLVA